jgi:hypothetical protein
LRIAARHQLADRLVIQQDPGRRGRCKRDRLAIDADLVIGGGSAAQLGHRAIDSHAAGGNPAFDFPPGPEPRGG